MVLFCFIAGRGEAAGQTSEQVFTGAKLLEACTKTDYDWIGFCNGYLQAAIEAAEYIKALRGGGKGEGICPPKGFTRNQAFNIVIPILMKDPRLQTNTGLSVVYALLSRAYPCD
jgi:hypothetical protein